MSESESRRRDKAPSQSSRNVIVVLGPHRSGTSLCAHMIQQLGVNMTQDPVLGVEENARGFWERRTLSDLQESILNTLGRGWNTPLHAAPMPDFWWRLPKIQVLKEKLREQILSETDSHDGLIGFKDPRTCLLLPLWKDIFKELGWTPTYILTTRHPSNIAASLKARDNIPDLAGEMIGFSYTLNALKNIGEDAFLVVSYESWFADPVAQIRSIATFTGLGTEQPDAYFKQLVEATVSDKLQHQQKPSKPDWPPAAALYDNVSRYAKTLDRRPLFKAMNALWDTYTFAQDLFEYAISSRKIEQESLSASQKNVSELEITNAKQNEELSRSHSQILAVQAEVSKRDVQALELKSLLDDRTQKLAASLEAISKRELLNKGLEGKVALVSEKIIHAAEKSALQQRIITELDLSTQSLETENKHHAIDLKEKQKEIETLNNQLLEGLEHTKILETRIIDSDKKLNDHSLALGQKTILLGKVEVAIFEEKNTVERLNETIFDLTVERDRIREDLKDIRLTLSNYTKSSDLTTRDIQQNLKEAYSQLGQLIALATKSPCDPSDLKISQPVGSFSPTELRGDQYIIKGWCWDPIACTSAVLVAALDKNGILGWCKPKGTRPDIAEITGNDTDTLFRITSARDPEGQLCVYFLLNNGRSIRLK